MKPQFRILLAAILAAVMIPGLVMAQGFDETLTVPSINFSIAYDSSWGIEQPQSDITIFLTNPDDSIEDAPDDPVTIVFPLPVEMGLPDAPAGDVLTLFLDDLLNLSDDENEVLEPVSGTTIAGYDAARIVFMVNEEGNEDNNGRWEAFLVREGDRQVALVGFAQDLAEWDDFAPTFAAWLETASFAGAVETPGSDAPGMAVTPLPPGELGGFSGAWQVAAARVLAYEGDPAGLPAPNGRLIAYEGSDEDSGDSQVCAFDTVTGVAACLDVPERTNARVRAEGMFWMAAWSPDSTRLAYVGLPYIFFRDADLIVYDFAAGTVTNLTDDGFNDSLMGFSDEGFTELPVEVQPAWSPDGTRIAVERTVFGEDERLTTLAVVDATTGGITEIGPIPSSNPAEPGRDAGTISGLDWSPDGTQLALLTIHQPFDFARDGLYLIDVATGEAELAVPWAAIRAQAEALFPDFFAGAPDDWWALAGPLDWSPDGARIMFWLTDPRYFMEIQQTPLIYDVASGELSAAALPAHPDENVPHPAALQAAWAPDGSQLLVLARQAELYPDDAFLPLEAGMDEEDAVYTLRLYDVASGEWSLLGQGEMNLISPYFAAWGAAGDVIAGGYAIQLGR